jgi:hypothetical protein
VSDATTHWHPASRKGRIDSPDGPPATTLSPAFCSDQTAVIRCSALAAGTKRAATAGASSIAGGQSDGVVTAAKVTRPRLTPKELKSVEAILFTPSFAADWRKPAGSGAGQGDGGTLRPAAGNDVYAVFRTGLARP